MIKSVQSMLLLLLGFSLPLLAQEPPVRVGVMLDSKDPVIHELWKEIDSEIRALFETSRTVEPARIESGDWSAQRSLEAYEQLVADPDVDVIINIGFVGGSVIARKKTFPKPVFVFGIMDPVVQGLAEARRNNSGIENLSYILLKSPLRGDLEFFREVVPFKKIALMLGSELVGALDAQTRALLGGMINTASAGLGDAEVQLVLVDNDAEKAAAAVASDVDAVYLGFFPRLKPESLTQLIAALNKRRLPTMGTELPWLEQGAMLTNATEADNARLARRMALNLEAVLMGEPAAELPVFIDFEERLTINWRTIREIGFPLRWDILSRAEVINDDYLYKGREIHLEMVMRESLTRNLAIKADEQAVISAQQDLANARARLRPTVDLGLTGSQIDDDRAASAQGSAAERTFSSNLTVQQLLYSEQASAGVAVSRQLLAADGFARDQTVLDAVLDTGLIYLDVLRARALVSVRKEDLILSRRNLETSRLRESVGYSGRADVYRWESEVVRNRQALIESEVQYRLAASRLNQILDRPQDETFRIKEEGTEMGMVSWYSDAFSSALTTPADLEVLLAFLIQEAMQGLPEIKQLDAQMAALERQLASNRKVRWVPTAALQGQADYTLDRAGVGSSPLLPATPEDLSWSVALNFSLPVFQGGKIRNDIAQTNAQIRQIAEQRRDLVNNLELNVRARMVELVSSYFDLDSSKQAAEWAGKSLELVQDGYAKGSITIVSLLDAQNAALNAREAAAVATFDMAQSILYLERALGDYSLFSPASKRLEDVARFQEFRKNYRPDK